MSFKRPGDPRLQQAAALLHSLLSGGEGGDPGQSPWHEVPSPTPEEPWLVSATDLLTNWSPQSPQLERLDQPLGHGDWDTYFEGPEPAFDPHPAAPAPALPQAPAPEPPQVPMANTAWPQVDVATTLSEEGELDDETATATVECLYDFAHALGRKDIEEAMACVATDYHAVEDDEEVDRTALRQQVEMLLDLYRGDKLEVSLTEVPEPVAFPDGLVVIPATLQFDARPTRGRPSSTLLARLVVLSRDQDGWRISGLSPRPDLEAPTTGPELVMTALAR